MDGRGHCVVVGLLGAGVVEADADNSGTADGWADASVDVAFLGSGVGTGATGAGCSLAAGSSPAGVLEPLSPPMMTHPNATPAAIRAAPTNNLRRGLA